MKKLSLLLSDLFGPDYFSSNSVNKCLVIPKCDQPKLIYDHVWEKQFDIPPPIVEHVGPKLVAPLKIFMEKWKPHIVAARKNFPMKAISK